MHVLVIDDNPDVLITTSTMFEMLGCRVTTLNGPQEVLSRVQQESPDIIVMDIGLPDKNGYELCIELREDGFKNPIIAHTGWGSEKDRERAHTSGFDDILTKPVSANDYKAMLAKHGGAPSLK